MIDNHPAAYPQSGLNGAALVFEALAEYGITRYMAVFALDGATDVAEIGPVRSARSYFVEWAKGLRAVYAHAGGSPEGLLLAETAIEIANLDALKGNAGTYFWRNKNRDAPHNLYTSSALLEQFISDTGAANVDSIEQGFLFKRDAPPAQRPASQRIDYFFLVPNDRVGWVYDPQSNGYNRLRRDRPHIDARSGQQIWFKNIVVMEIKEAPIPNDPKARIDQQVIGEGVARVFSDGMMREITWRKLAGYAPLRFYDAADKEVSFTAGPIWIAAVPQIENVTVKGG